MIVDFDMTLTVNYYYAGSGSGCSKGWIRTTTTHGLFSHLPKDRSLQFNTRSSHLLKKYLPIEHSSIISLSLSEKMEKMVEWWTQSHALIVQLGVSRGDLGGIVKRAVLKGGEETGGVILRDGVLEMFQICRSSQHSSSHSHTNTTNPSSIKEQEGTDNNNNNEEGTDGMSDDDDDVIPVLVFSAGIYDLIERILVEYDIIPSPNSSHSQSHSSLNNNYNGVLKGGNGGGVVEILSNRMIFSPPSSSAVSTAVSTAGGSISKSEDEDVVLNNTHISTLSTSYSKQETGPCKHQNSSGDETPQTSQEPQTLKTTSDTNINQDKGTSTDRDAESDSKRDKSDDKCDVDEDEEEWTCTGFADPLMHTFNKRLSLIYHPNHTSTHHHKNQNKDRKGNNNHHSNTSKPDNNENGRGANTCENENVNDGSNGYYASYISRISHRRNIIVMGDSLGDVHMASMRDISEEQDDDGVGGGEDTIDGDINGKDGGCVLSIGLLNSITIHKKPTSQSEPQPQPQPTETTSIDSIIASISFESKSQQTQEEMKNSLRRYLKTFDIVLCGDSSLEGGCNLILRALE